ncbi:MAG: hypothetical protein Kow001_05100 [Acidobacteriota bacterium]
MDFIALAEQEFRQIGSVLAGDASDQRSFHPSLQTRPWSLHWPDPGVVPNGSFGTVVSAGSRQPRTRATKLLLGRSGADEGVCVDLNPLPGDRREGWKESADLSRVIRVICEIRAIRVICEIRVTRVTGVIRVISDPAGAQFRPGPGCRTTTRLRLRTAVSNSATRASATKVRKP